MTGIYKIESKIHPDRIYIGSSSGIYRRWGNHRYDLKKNKHGSKKLQNHYNKYGINDLIFSITELCFSEFLIAREQYYIDKLKPFFNNCKIAASQLGIKRSEETKRKISEAKKGLYAGEKNPNFGRKHTKEEKQKMSDAHKSRTHHKQTEEWKKLARERMIGEKNPNYGKDGWNKGKIGVYSEDTLNKMSLAKIGKPSKIKGIKKPPASLELRIKRSINQQGIKNNFYGKHHTDESRQKIKESWIKRKLKIAS